jgi:hypothetical protein
VLQDLSEYKKAKNDGHIPMHKQMDRLPNLSQAHDERFENINKSPGVLSTVKRAPQVISFDKQKPRGDESMVNHKTVFKYSTGVDTLTTKRRDISISMDKCLDRAFEYTNSISASIAPRDNSYNFGTSYDDLRASE